MGIMTRQLGEDYVITSDCDPGEVPLKRLPKKMLRVYHVWTGDAWSAVTTEAKSFDSIEEADDYLKTNYARVTGQR